MKTFVPFHFSRIVVLTAICMSAASSLCQTMPTEKKLGTNLTLQKIIEVRQMRDSVNKTQDSLIEKLNKAIAEKNRKDIVKKNR